MNIPNYYERKPITIKEQVYEGLKKQILDGIIRPGEWLQEKKLSEYFNVSRSPIREVLIELVGEGLLENIPNKGVFVKVLSEKDIYNIFELRKILERYAIEKVIEEASDEEILQFEKIQEILEEFYLSGDLKKYSKIDSALHDTIFKTSGNDILIDVVNHLYPQLQPFRLISLNNKKRFEESYDEHKGIIRGLLERDFQKAWSFASIHLELARDEIIRHIRNIQIQNLENL